MVDEKSMMDTIKSNIENDSTLSSLIRLVKVDGGNIGDVHGTTVFITCLNPKDNIRTFSGTQRYNVDISVSFVQPQPNIRGSNETHRKVMDNLIRVIESDHSLNGQCNGIQTYEYNNPQEIEDENIRIRNTDIIVSYSVVE